MTPKCFPSVCKTSQTGAVYQYYHRESDGYEECHVIGRYDGARDDTFYHLIDERDPSKGVSIQYVYGEKCPGGSLRTATIDMLCANTKVEIQSALEPEKCNYHLVMKSYHGCPLVR